MFLRSAGEIWIIQHITDGAILNPPDEKKTFPPCFEVKAKNEAQKLLVGDN